MRIVSSFALAVFLASTSTSIDAFGPAVPLRATPFGVASSSMSSPSSTYSSSATLTMRIGFNDLGRKQRINEILHSNPTQEVVQTVLLSPETSAVIQKCNWKVRNSLIRKVRLQAARYGLPVDPKFGLPPTQIERETTEREQSVIREQERVAAMATAKAQVLARQEARQVKRAANKARAAEFSKKLKVEREARQAAKQEAEPKPQPVAVVDEAVQEEAPAVEEVVAVPEPVAEIPAPVPFEEPVVEEEPAVPEPVAETSEPEPETPVPEPVAETAATTTTAAPAGGEITPKTIKALRDATGAGMMDCKNALIESDGDQEAAAEYLRKKGLAKADKKASRVAAEGRIAVATSGNKAVMVEVNCETDFVAKDDSFLGFCEKVASAAVAVNGDDVAGLMATEVDGEALETTRQGMVAKIGENIQVRRMASRGGEGSTVGAYVHMNRMGVLVELEGGSQQLCVDVAMHIAAMNPPYATPDDVPAEVLQKEKKLLTEQALESGKPPEIVEKMVEGRIRKYLEDICLVSQSYVRDGDKTVGKLLEENGAKIIGFTRLAVGEGIEKKEDDFAAEVAKMAGIKTEAPAPAPESPAPEVQEKAPEPVAAAQVDEAPAAPSAAGGEVTPKTIKQLRDATGAGMMDCKKALIEANGDQEIAAENLRKKGLSKADKKASRIAAEGKIMIANSGNKGVMVEINCETDFVAKDGSFLGFCEKVAGAAIAADSDAIENLMATEVEGESLEATRQAMVAKIGENIQVRRMASRGGEGRTVGGYVHMNTIGVLVELEGGNQQLCTDVAMHIAAMKPPFATADDVPAEVLEKERRILSEQALESGKKPEIVEKMVEGRIRKFLEEKCLVSQPYVKDGDKTVGKLLEENGAKIIGFTRLVVGEGIEKKQDDFAAEVAKMAGIKSNEPEPAAV